MELLGRREDDANVARLVERLQLGAAAGRHRRVRRLQAPLPADPDARSSIQAATQRQLLLPCLRSAGPLDGAERRRVDRWGQQRAPVFQLAFANTSAASHALAAVDEDGGVAVFDTRAARPQPPTAWAAHRNAVFDVVWTRDDRQLVTAAGDLQLRGWDVETQRAAFALVGHRMSVKCVRQQGHGPTFASGARDGHVMLWDTRLPGGKPVGVLPNVHAAPSPSASSAPPSARPSSGRFLSPAPSARKKRRATASNRPAPPRSVTCVEFAPDGQELATAGAVDSVVKFWDLRRLSPFSAIDAASSGSNASPLPTPTRRIDCGAPGGTQRGVSALAFGRDGATLLVSVLNDTVKVVDVLAAGGYSTNSTDRPSALLECVGHAATSFYVKAAFSPGDDFIVGGSADGAVYIWDASVSGSRTRPWSVCQPELQPERRAAERRLPVLALKGHESDVNGVAWSPQDVCRIASGSDDGTVRLWRADRPDPDAERQERGGDTRTQSESRSFRLRESAAAARGWHNWKEFLEQPDGRAYPVAAAAAPNCQPEDAAQAKQSDQADAQAETPAAPSGLDASPMVIRRSGSFSDQRRAARRRQRPAQTEADPVDGTRASRVRARAAGRRFAPGLAAAETLSTSGSGQRQQTTLFDCWQQ